MVCGRNAINLSTITVKHWGQAEQLTSSTPPEWELFDLEKDPHEMHNVYAAPAYAGIVVELKAELQRLRDELEDYE